MGISSMCFFSSRRRHTRYIGDWSSDVCSSDLHCGPLNPREAARAKRIRQESDHAARKLGEEIHRALTPQGHGEIGRASCRERVKIWAVSGPKREEVHNWLRVLDDRDTRKRAPK